MLAKTALAFSVLVLQANAFWRLPCRQRLALERIDPIDTPGNVGRHVHTIHGGNRFAQAVTNDELRASECSSCEVKQDKSAYWTPNMYWESPEGDLIALNQTGGMLVYYLQRGENLKNFPPDFRMIAGDNRLRNFTWDDSIQKSDFINYGLNTNQDFLRQKAIGFNCLNYDEPANAALGLQHIPQGANCKDGLRAEVFFPSCWNGKDSDSPDHRSHVAYPSTVDDGDCPKGFEHRLPSLFFETIWDVGVVTGKGGRLVFSSGDATGYGYHGDFMNGWDVDVLAAALEQCTNPSGVVEDCGVFDFYTPDEYSQCKKTPEVKEDVWGPMKHMPGCNEISAGPSYAPLGGCHDDKSKDESRQPAPAPHYSVKPSKARVAPSRHHSAKPSAPPAPPYSPAKAVAPEAVSSYPAPARGPSHRVKPDHVKASHVKANRVKANRVKASRVKPNYVKPSHAKPNYAKPEYVKPERTKPDYVKPDVQSGNGDVVIVTVTTYEYEGAVTKTIPPPPDVVKTLVKTVAAPPVIKTVHPAAHYKRNLQHHHHRRFAH